MIFPRFIFTLLVLCVFVDSQNESLNCELLRDFDSQCDGWNKLGYCDKESLYYWPAKEICPSSCSGCGFNYHPKDDCEILTDNFSTCRLWAFSGHCSYHNKQFGYMMEQCAFSCAGCTPPLYGEDEQCALLRDYHVDCVKWADEGLCEGESDAVVFIKEQCSYSCNGCLKGICSVAKDATEYCTEYKARGWCSPRHYYYRQIIGDCEATCNDCV